MLLFTLNIVAGKCKFLLPVANLDPFARPHKWQPGYGWGDHWGFEVGLRHPSLCREGARRSEAARPTAHTGRKAKIENVLKFETSQWIKTEKEPIATFWNWRNQFIWNTAEIENIYKLKKTLYTETETSGNLRLRLKNINRSGKFIGHLTSKEYRKKIEKSQLKLETSKKHCIPR